jgi:carbon starvation protein
MWSLGVILFSSLGYIVAYRTYGRFLSRRIFRIDPTAVTPAQSKRDDFDYMPTRKEMLFGHHFTSIAGTGPIVGPAIGIIWGWLPALLWVFFGSIFMGAVHDFGALVVSTRSGGRSIGDLVDTLISPRVRTLFLLIVGFTLWIVLAIFVMLVAVLFDMYPQAVFPVWMEIPIALGLGYAIYRRNANPVLWAVVAVVLMYATVLVGAYMPLRMPGLLGMSPFTVWVLVLLSYCYVASVMPIWSLLQPRDYINAHELIVCMVLLFLGVIVARPDVVAPIVNLSPRGAPPLLPIMFVTVACGAISGFHSLVASGTSSKQLSSEKHALFIGYGSMLLEGVLAILVLVAVGAGIGSEAAFSSHYASWTQASGLGAKLSAFVEGSANMLGSLGIPRTISVTVMGVLIASFAGTTLDTATRIQRYVITELSASYRSRIFASRHRATALAVVTAALLALSQGGGRGGLILWPLFGTANQLLAALSLLVLSVYLLKKRIRALYTLIPMVFMIAVTGWAMVINLQEFVLGGDWHLAIIGGLILLLEIWMIVEAVSAYSAFREGGSKMGR